MTHESEDQGFQEGRAVAEYLETHPCAHGVGGTCHVVCSDCIDAAVEAVENAFRADAEKNAAELAKVIALRKKRIPIVSGIQQL